MSTAAFQRVSPVLLGPMGPCSMVIAPMGGGHWKVRSASFMHGFTYAPLMAISSWHLAGKNVGICSAANKGLVGTHDAHTNAAEMEMSRRRYLHVGTPPLWTRDEVSERTDCIRSYDGGRIILPAFLLIDFPTPRPPSPGTLPRHQASQPLPLIDGNTASSLTATGTDGPTPRIPGETLGSPVSHRRTNAPRRGAHGATAPRPRPDATSDLGPFRCVGAR